MRFLAISIFIIYSGFCFSQTETIECVEQNSYDDGEYSGSPNSYPRVVYHGLLVTISGQETFLEFPVQVDYDVDALYIVGQDNEFVEITLANTSFASTQGIAEFIIDCQVSDDDMDPTNELDNTDEQEITAFSLAGNVLTITIENGNTRTVNLGGLQDGIGTDDQNITGVTFVNGVLTVSIENGTGQSVDLSTLQEDNQVLSVSQNPTTDQVTISLEDGGAVQTIDLTKFLQTLSIVNDELRISGVSGGVPLTDYLEDDQNITTLALSNDLLTIAIENGNSRTIDISGSDNQALNYNPTTKIISISNSTSEIDANPFFDNTDDQQMGRSGNTLTLESSPNVDLSDLDEELEVSKVGEGAIKLDGSVMKDDRYVVIIDSINIINYDQTQGITATDDQIVTQFELLPDNETLRMTIEDGNTIDADLSAFSTEKETCYDQTINAASSYDWTGQGAVIPVDASKYRVILNSWEMTKVGSPGQLMEYAVTGNQTNFYENLDNSLVRICIDNN